MAKNGIFTRLKFVIEAAIAAITSGDPVLIGTGGLHGVAQIDTDGDGNVEVDVGGSVYDLSVKAVDDDGDSAVAVGDRIFYVAADTPKLSKKKSGTFFGIALEAIIAGSTDTIKVLTQQAPPALLAFLAGFHVATVADDNKVGGIPVLHRVDIADASGDTDVVLTHKTRIVDVWLRSSGIGAHGTDDHVQVFNGANAVTNEIAKTATVNSVVHASTINPTYEEIAAGGTLKVTAVKSTNVACTVYVLGVRVA